MVTQYPSTTHLWLCYIVMTITIWSLPMHNANHWMMLTPKVYSICLLLCSCKVNRLPMKGCLSVQHLEMLTMDVECPLNTDAIQIWWYPMHNAHYLYKKYSSCHALVLMFIDGECHILASSIDPEGHCCSLTWLSSFYKEQLAVWVIVKCSMVI